MHAGRVLTGRKNRAIGSAIRRAVGVSGIGPISVMAVSSLSSAALGEGYKVQTKANAMITKLPADTHQDCVYR